ncbi:hypothetical protein [Legionella cardiaca]|uniref:Transmembrane protein n=1 Tax=Legionella cardiaca TaxID=1071983 RepID=A0ABY8ASB2_9GAMM|nr:hypothetical protein [Legionella cardiaca]WED43548.1 hypothetical protein PXX05_01880 [Legionella cardiaca]
MKKKIEDVINNNDEIPIPKSITKKKPSRNNLPLKRSASQHVKFARKMHEIGCIYALYGILDAEISTYGSMRYFFDVLFAGQSSSQLIHNWLLTPTGVAVALIESTVFVSLSLLNSTKDDDTKSAFRQTVSSFWPYCRSAISELKKTNRGVGNTLKIATFFSAQNLNHLVMPLGLTFGAVSVLNRIWYQQMHNRRKEMKKRLTTLLQEISELNPTSFGDNDQCLNLEIYYNQIEDQSLVEQKSAYLSAAYTGLAEGLAFYVGILTFVSVTSSAFIPMVTCCVAFAMISIATRIYEEYEHQRSLAVDRLLIQLRLKQKEIETLDIVAGNMDINNQYEYIFGEIIELSKQLDAKAISSFNKTLKGLKEGLRLYAFVNKIILGATVFFSTVPAALLIGSIVAGILILLATTIKSVLKQSKPVEQPLNYVVPAFSDYPQEHVSQLVDRLIQVHVSASIEKPSSFRAWFEVTWSFFSGLDKGRKSIGYLLMLALIEMSLHDNYQDSPTVINVSIAVGMVSSLIFALRAHTLNFGTHSEKEEMETREPSKSQVLMPL